MIFNVFFVNSTLHNSFLLQDESTTKQNNFSVMYTNFYDNLRMNTNSTKFVFAV